jgi:hypothetical protein
VAKALIAEAKQLVPVAKQLVDEGYSDFTQARASTATPQELATAAAGG